MGKNQKKKTKLDEVSTAKALSTGNPTSNRMSRLVRIEYNFPERVHTVRYNYNDPGSGIKQFKIKLIITVSISQRLFRRVDDVFVRLVPRHPTTDKLFGMYTMFIGLEIKKKN